MVINIQNETGSNLLECKEIPHMHIYNAIVKEIPEASDCEPVDELRDPRYASDHIGIFGLFSRIEESFSNLTIVVF